MLFYYCASEDRLPAIRREGVRTPGGVLLRTRLEDARAAGEPVLVVAAAALPEPPVPAGPDLARAIFLPADAVLNLVPYRPPRPVTAAGGFVMRPGTGAPDVLLIFRRGVWDLPKGKLDAGETAEAAALREVREEVGIDTLVLREALGATVHGYVEKDRYRVKTTYWYLMETPERDFTPQAEEDIEAVAWVPWDEARRRLGYASLRDHMDRAAPILRRQTWLGWPDAPELLA